MSASPNVREMGAFFKHSGLLLLLVLFASISLPIQKATATIKQCCPEGVETFTISGSGSTWYATTVHRFAGQTVPNCDLCCYDVDVTLKLSYTSNPGSCTGFGWALAHEGNSTCNADNAANRPPCVKADCIIPENQVLGNIDDSHGFNKGTASHITVTSASNWSPSTPTVYCQSWYIGAMDSMYDSAFAGASWGTPSGGCTQLRGVNCICNQGGSNCT